MSNNLYVKFLVRKLITFLEKGDKKEVNKLLKKILNELNN
tara:strand:- start:178 stop:297 length:120 start_codon:yes stop_codon:yes gene_type:complete